MSTPNDKIRVRKTPNCAHLYTATVKGKGAYGFGNTPQEARDSLARQTAQPSPAAVEQVTQPDRAGDFVYWKQYKRERDALQVRVNTLRETADRATARADALQAEVNYYKQAYKNDVKQLGQTIDRLNNDRDALQAQRDELVKRVNGLSGRLAICRAIQIRIAGCAKRGRRRHCSRNRRGAVMSERDTLQAQRDELLETLKHVRALQYDYSEAVRANVESVVAAAIGRATEGEKANES